MMMNILVKRFLLLLPFLLLVVCRAEADSYEFITEELPPYSFHKGDRITGGAVEVVRELIKRRGAQDNIKVLSWSVAYQRALHEEGIVLFSTARTKEREKLFKWVGPIVGGGKLAFFARRGAGIKIASLDDARRLEKIGVYKDDMAEQYLHEEGFRNLENTFVSGQNVKKLVAGRIDLWVENLAIGVEIAKREGLSGEIEPVFELPSPDLYMAFGLSTPDDEIVKWQEALDGLKAEGLFGKMMKQFGMETR